MIMIIIMILDSNNIKNETNDKGTIVNMQLIFKYDYGK